MIVASLSSDYYHYGTLVSSVVFAVMMAWCAVFVPAMRSFAVLMIFACVLVFVGTWVDRMPIFLAGGVVWIVLLRGFDSDERNLDRQRMTFVDCVQLLAADSGRMDHLPTAMRQTEAIASDYVKVVQLLPRLIANDLMSHEAAALARDIDDRLAALGALPDLEAPSTHDSLRESPGWIKIQALARDLLGLLDEPVVYGRSEARIADR